jgi:cholesterol oxidase
LAVRGCTPFVGAHGHGRPKVHWPQLRDRTLFTAEKARAIARPLGGMFVKDPLDTRLFMNNLITVHPLGGCPNQWNKGSHVSVI